MQVRCLVGSQFVECADAIGKKARRRAQCGRGDFSYRGSRGLRGETPIRKLSGGKHVRDIMRAIYGDRSCKLARACCIGIGFRRGDNSGDERLRDTHRGAAVAKLIKSAFFIAQPPPLVPQITLPGFHKTPYMHGLLESSIDRLFKTAKTLRFSELW